MKLTAYILLINFALLLAYDFWAVQTGGYDATISVVIYKTAKDWPILPFIFGVLIGHFFLPITTDRKSQT